MGCIGQGRPLSLDFVLEALTQVIPTPCIEEVLDRVGGKRRRRTRKIPLVGVVWLVVGIGLFGDLDIPSIWRQVTGTLRSLLASLAEIKPPTKSALSRARQRLGARAMRLLFKLTATTAAQIGGARSAQLSPDGYPEVGGAFYRGMRLLGIDGQKMTAPDTPENARAFGRCYTRRGSTKVAAGYPQVLSMRLVELGTHIGLETLIKPACHAEAPVAAYLLKSVPAGSLLLWDSAFYSYKLLKQAMEQGVHLLGRVPWTPLFEPVEHLSDDSILAYVYPDPWARRRGDRSKAILVRVIRYTLDDPHRPGDCDVHRLVTTLLDEKKYPARELILLYHQRWELEIDNDELTTHQLNRPVDLRSQTPVGVVQEIYGVLLAHNAIRRLMHESAKRWEIDPRTLSFIHAVRVIKETIPLMRAADTEQLPSLYKAMLEQIGQGRLPARDNRINPRVIKVKMSKWPKKRPRHYNPPPPQKSFVAAIVMLK
jgi:Insertion element 4 transposase N-terminal/Transposase DDE domain